MLQPLTIAELSSVGAGVADFALHGTYVLVEESFEAHESLSPTQGAASGHRFAVQETSVSSWRLLVTVVAEMTVDVSV